MCNNWWDGWDIRLREKHYYLYNAQIHPLKISRVFGLQKDLLLWEILRDVLHFYQHRNHQLPPQTPYLLFKIITSIVLCILYHLKEKSVRWWMKCDTSCNFLSLPHLFCMQVFEFCKFHLKSSQIFLICTGFCHYSKMSSMRWSFSIHHAKLTKTSRYI